MGVFDKIKFWKKEDDFGVPGTNEQPPAYDLGAPQRFDPMTSPDPLASQHDPLGQEGFPHDEHIDRGGGPPAYPSYPAPAAFPGSQSRQMPQEQYPEHDNQATAVQSRDVELILAKLDAVKSELDALHQRVRKIEQFTDAQQQQQIGQKKYW